MLKKSPNLEPFPGKSGKKSPAGTQVRRKTFPFRGFGEKSIFTPFSFSNLSKNAR